MGLRAPENKGNGLGETGKGEGGVVGEGLPAKIAVTVGLSGGDGQDGVEKEDALSGPTGQVAVGRGGTAEIVFQFAEDVAE